MKINLPLEYDSSNSNPDDFTFTLLDNGNVQLEWDNYCEEMGSSKRMVEISARNFATLVAAWQAHKG